MGGWVDKGFVLLEVELWECKRYLEVGDSERVLALRSFLHR